LILRDILLLLQHNMKFTYDYLWRTLARVYEAGEAKSVIKLLLEKRFGLSQTDVFCGKVESLGKNEDIELDKMLNRLMSHEPIQYVLGEAEFGGYEFFVRQGVLIPRPETAELVNDIIEDVSDSRDPDSRVSILDIGTGSGCIAVSLSLAIPGCKVSAWDLSDMAIDISRENAKKLGADAEICRIDALHPPCDVKKWDVIVSNPPYICENERTEMEKNVLDYEPEMALFVPDDDPLRFYRAIAQYAGRALKIGGSLYFEINPVYEKEMVKMLSDKGFKSIVLMEDSFGKKRFVKCR
jgi:release factor glutamine methyltransferase